MCNNLVTVQTERPTSLIANLISDKLVVGWSFKWFGMIILYDIYIYILYNIFLI